MLGMSLRSAAAVLSRRVSCCSRAAALIAPAAAFGASSDGSHEQIAWVRRAASNFVAAELAGNGAGACAILNAPLRATQHHRTCAQRWNAKLSKLLREPGGRARLRAQQRAIPAAAVVVHGNVASIEPAHAADQRIKPLPLDRKLLDARGLAPAPTCRRRSYNAAGRARHIPWGVCPRRC